MSPLLYGTNLKLVMDCWQQTSPW